MHCQQEVQMLVIIKSAPDTTEGKRAVALAKDSEADICLIQNGVYFTQGGRLRDFRGVSYLIEEDARLRGLKDSELHENTKKIDYEALVDLLSGSDKTIGAF
jgi:sulfur relay protein TusB/DsrH